MEQAVREAADLAQDFVEARIDPLLESVEAPVEGVEAARGDAKPGVYTVETAVHAVQARVNAV